MYKMYNFKPFVILYFVKTLPIPTLYCAFIEKLTKKIKIFDYTN